MFTLPKFLVQEVVTCKNVISSRSSNQRRSFTTETCLKWNMIHSCQFLAPVSCARKMALKTRSHWQVFWHKKLATETCQSERGFNQNIKFYQKLQALQSLMQENLKIAQNTKTQKIHSKMTGKQRQADAIVHSRLRSDLTSSCAIPSHTAVLVCHLCLLISCDLALLLNVAGLSGILNH